MPELPEVETTRAGIAPYITGQQVDHVVIRQSKLRWPITAGLTQELPGQTIQAVKRRAKYLLLATPAGHVCLHLGMSGKLRVLPATTPAQTHDHVDIVFQNGLALRFNDARRFGSIFWLKQDPEDFSLLTHLGPEPLGDNFNGQWLADCAARRRLAVKNFIMDSKVVVGVGNIYASEALHAARIDPRQPANQVSLRGYALLADCIKQVLEQAINAGGTTLRDYVGVHGDTGYFQQQLAVYGREGLACPRGCGIVQKTIIGQRSTFFCPRCQQ